ncbi:hypothetical protein MKW94_011786 [Papaver nudicaule]|uniref:Uncharacterized protein n=1 Tax=Papaver nudicaule TaxID=74823 RepID=A0AA41RVY9_PAPNU|nr:hypothetical protein [Papaver nudicaule]
MHTVWPYSKRFAAELLWLAKKMSTCGNADVAVSSWGSTSRLAWLSLSAEPRVQGALVKISGDQKDDNEDVARITKKHDEDREKKMKLLMSWLPFLCRASNGTDAPVLSTSDRAEVERAIEDLIGMFKKDQQEKVLSLWLHHFTSCPLSDWPNLLSCYNSWLDASRKLLVI